MSKNFTNNQIKHVKSDGIEYLQFKKLNEYSDKLKHGISLRKGGVSTGVHESLNFRILGTDSKYNVIRNLELLCSKLDINTTDLYKATQNHTDYIKIIDSSNKKDYEFIAINRESYDGYITYEKNIATLITTADCNPVIIYDFKKNIVANVHSGWKGTVKQIYLNAARMMNEKFNCKYSDMIACVGPSINKCCWNSSDLELKNKFLKVWNYEHEYIVNKEDGEYFVDFPYVIKKDLINIGLSSDNVILSDICTCCNCEEFFSYRMSKKLKHEDYGTMATITMLV